MSNNRNIVNNLLAHLAARAGLPQLMLNAKGICALHHPDGLYVIFDLPSDSDLLFIYSPIFSLAHVPSDAFFGHLLELNLDIQATGGAIFAIDSERKNVVLSFGRWVSDYDETNFLNSLDKFLDLGLHWSDYFKKEKNIANFSSHSSN